MKLILILIFTFGVCAAGGGEVALGTWMRTKGIKLGHLNDDPIGVRLMEQISPKDERSEIADLQTVPPELFASYGDSVFVFSSCKFHSCAEKLAFVFDANAEVGFFYSAISSEVPNPGTVMSTNCTRKLFEEKYEVFVRKWLAKENILISENVFWMKSTRSDTILEQTHRFALKAFKLKKYAAAADTLYALRKTDPREYGEYHVAIYNDLGYFLEEANRNQEAIPILEEVVAWDGRRTPAYLNLGDAYAKAGEMEKAKINYRKYVDLMGKSGKGTKVPLRIRTFLKP